MNLGQAKKKIARLEQIVLARCALIQRMLPFMGRALPEEECEESRAFAKINHDAVAVLKIGSDCR
jgi:hypothetical protein